ncbi:MAG: AraC family transcriptional regulator [Pseudomonadota bacterium]|nr:AraC family transcriptional regulator [Pseudomonadota bacterium]
MIDPLAQAVTLLAPRASYSKTVSGAGAWRLRRSHGGEPGYFVILDGACRLTIDGQTTTLQAGDFVLVPAAFAFTLASISPVPENAPDNIPVALTPGEFRIGTIDAPCETRYLVGHFVFDAPDAALLVSLLPRLVHVRGQPRLSTLVQLVSDESRAIRPGRDVVLSRLLEVLLIEALRVDADSAASPGLLRGIADERLAVAIRCIHEQPEQAWTVVQLAQEAALSRSAFFARFQRTVGMAPMAYLLTWRMALGKQLLRSNENGIAEVAQRVGYGSASAFSVAFTRHVGMPPTRYARNVSTP